MLNRKGKFLFENNFGIFGTLVPNISVVNDYNKIHSYICL